MSVFERIIAWIYRRQVLFFLLAVVAVAWLTWIGGL